MMLHAFCAVHMVFVLSGSAEMFCLSVSDNVMYIYVICIWSLQKFVDFRLSMFALYLLPNTKVLMPAYTDLTSQSITTVVQRRNEFKKITVPRLLPCPQQMGLSYYAVVLIGRIMRLAACPSVCPIRKPNWRSNKCRKPVIGADFSQGGSSWFAGQFSLQKVTISGHHKPLISALEVIFNVMRSINPRFTYLLTYLLLKVTHLSRQCVLTVAESRQQPRSGRVHWCAMDGRPHEWRHMAWRRFLYACKCHSRCRVFSFGPKKLLFPETWPKMVSVGRIFFGLTMVLNYAN